MRVELRIFIAENKSLKGRNWKLLRDAETVVSQFVMGEYWEILEDCAQKLQRAGCEPGTETLKSCQQK